MRQIIVVVGVLFCGSAQADDVGAGDDSYWLNEHAERMAKCGEVLPSLQAYLDQEYGDSPSLRPSGWSGGRICEKLRRDLSVLDCRFNTAEEAGKNILHSNWEEDSEFSGIPRFVANRMRENANHVGGEDQKQINIDRAWAMYEAMVNRAVLGEQQIWPIVDDIEAKYGEYESAGCLDNDSFVYDDEEQD